MTPDSCTAITRNRIMHRPLPQLWNRTGLTSSGISIRNWILMENIWYLSVLMISGPKELIHQMFQIPEGMLSTLSTNLHGEPAGMQISSCRGTLTVGNTGILLSG